MKQSILTLIAITLYITAKAQIFGHIQSSENQAISFANVILLQASDSSFIRGVLSDDKGDFSIESVDYGRYLINVKFIGYEDWYSESFSFGSSRPQISFDNIILNEETQLLQGVEVRAQKMLVEQTIEGTTINVENSMMSQGNSALDLLERSPGVILDRRNNNLTLNGQSGTLIMINGRPIRMSASEVANLLNGMSADNVKKIELLTNPSAKYDADGTAGIINLILKKNEGQGTKGSISLSAGYGKGQKETASLNLNHSTPTVNYFGAYSFSYDDSYSTWHGVGGGDNPEPLTFDFVNVTESANTNHNLQLGVEKTLANDLLLGTNLLYNHSSTGSDVYNTGEYSFLDGDFLGMQIDIFGQPKWDNFNATIFAEKQINETGKINIDADYLYFYNHSPTNVTNSYYDQEGNVDHPENDVYADANRGESQTDLHIGVLKVDYSQNLNDKLKLETGVKGSYSVTNNTAFIDRYEGENWVKDPENVSSSEIIEKIGAVYASFQYNVDSTTTMTIGTRYEYWDRDFGELADKRKYGKFFPSFFLSKTLSDKTSLQFAYNRRISRPSYNDLTNFLMYNDPVSVFSGNPLLQPAISDNFKAGYQWKDLNFALVYTHESNPIVRYQLAENEQSEMVVIGPQNMAYQKQFAFQTHLPIQITKWWTFNIGGSTGWREFKLEHTAEKVRKDYVAYNLYANQSILLPRNFSMEISGFYNSDHYYGSMQAQDFGMMNLGIKKDLKDNKGSFQITVTDVLQSMRYTNDYGALTQEAYDSKSHVVFRPESGVNRIFRISYSRTFGNDKGNGRKRQPDGASEENNRIRRE